MHENYLKVKRDTAKYTKLLHNTLCREDGLDGCKELVSAVLYLGLSMLNLQNSWLFHLSHH